MESGLHFGEFGPGDQGAYSKFYQGQFDVVQLEAITGATLPPQGSCTSTGPKPNDYLSYLSRGHNRGASHRSCSAS